MSGSTNHQDGTQGAQLPQAVEPPLKLISAPIASFDGPHALGFAMSAPVAILHGEPWNAFASAVEKEALAQWWEIRHSQSWAGEAYTLLAGRNISGEVENVLDLRVRTLAEIGLSSLTVAEWLRAVVSSVSGGEYSDEVIDELRTRTQRIARYEARLRADGVLPPDGFVTSALAYDFGRAPVMAGWGYTLGYCTREEAESILVSAAHRARRMYTSWEQFSAGFILGQLMRLDDDSTGEVYDNAVHIHRILLSERDSPWRNVPFVTTRS